MQALNKEHTNTNCKLRNDHFCLDKNLMRSFTLREPAYIFSAPPGQYYTQLLSLRRKLRECKGDDVLKT
jgi:hypothetical protein